MSFRKNKQEKKRFSTIPRKVRKIFTKNINNICKEEKVPKEEISIIIVSALSQAEEIKKEKKCITWKKVWNHIYKESLDHIVILNSIYTGIGT